MIGWGDFREIADTWIQIIVDRIIPGEFPWLLRRAFLFEMLLSGTLFHEVGHHLDATIGSPSRTGERAADKWSDILRREFFRKNHRILTPLLAGFAKLMKPVADRKVAEIIAESRRPPN